jgi:hypothetical protein
LQIPQEKPHGDALCPLYISLWFVRGIVVKSKLRTAGTVFGYGEHALSEVIFNDPYFLAKSVEGTRIFQV